MSFKNILDKYRKISFSERDKGARFERLMQRYLQTDPTYATLFKKVWLWEEFPGKNDLGGGDTGIDLVALTYDGDYWAVQCKCYQETSTIDKPAVDSFLSTSSRKFKGEDLKTVSFAHRLWISTTNKWGANATEAILNQNPPVTRINLFDLQEASVDWQKLEDGVHGEAARTPKKSLRPHQKEALTKTHEYFKNHDRGKLIMACGTGKTFNSLRIAEHETNGKGLILFLVPSIALLGQSLREWSADANEPINAVCICSDPEISRKKSKNDDTGDTSVVDLALPASTDAKMIVHQFRQFKDNGKKGMTVVFSTYQSIDVIAKAQKALQKELGLGEFDLIICDEAHRTTGVKLAEEDESSFTKVHDNKFIQAKKRLYMTATPRLFSDDSKSKAAKADAVLCSMDDTKLYGEEIYRIGFGEAVEKDLLTDYKVLILTLNENDVPPAVQKMITQANEVNTDDVSKLIGCVNALSKQILGDQGIIKDSDPEPMRRAVAFCQKIDVSKKITSTLNTATDVYISTLPMDKREQMVSVESRHIDGSMSAPERDGLLGWLKEDIEDGECRILTNVRCLSEGVDVPSLDAVMFLSARNSQVDVVQSVGRVMRKAPNKKYGYIIIPVVVPSNVEPDKALDDNERYKVVWTVLNALRAHDDRFNATVNKIELNRKKPDNILIGRPGVSYDERGNAVVNESDTSYGNNKISQQLALQFEQLQSVVFARMVQKVGDRRYWEQWAKDVADIATNYVERINKIRKESTKHEVVFVQFMKGLHKNINPSITADEAVEMLAQHMITKPVFEALFEGYSFVNNNAISVSMQAMIDLLEEQMPQKDLEVLERFYESVKKRASEIDNAEGKQRIIVELYDKFFKTAFPKMVERLGIVYTPVEVVDFIIQSVNDVLKKEFGRTLSDENVNILDPFTGTGTFITRLLQSGLIDKKDLHRKYHNEIFANEIVLLAYYIAAVNIENAYHDAMGIDNYESFEGICLTDTFQLGETEEGDKLFKDMFPQNTARVKKQKNAPLRVIIGNPPYSVGQKSGNDIAQNQKYDKLDARVELTYARESAATSVKALYDSYIKAFRWSTDRLDKSGGIVCFVSNGGWLNSNGMDGFRKSLEKEFSNIYILNLRGNANSQGEFRRKEAGNVFGGGSKTPVAITLLVKNPKLNVAKATIHYHDIGDYLSREEKLTSIQKFQSINNTDIGWKLLSPNEHGDWISQRSDVFGTFIPIAPEKKVDNNSNSFFINYSLGLATGRDAWVLNFSSEKLIKNIKSTIKFFNEQSNSFKEAKAENHKLKPENFIETDPKKISWNRNFINDLEKYKNYSFHKENIVDCIYRPFFKNKLYFDKDLNAMLYQNKKLFPNSSLKNLVICVSGIGGNKDFATLISSHIPILHVVENGQSFPLYYYDERDTKKLSLFDANSEDNYIRRDGISDFILGRAKQQYGKSVTKEDIFYYVYGFLHSPEYRETFANDLKKMLPRLPLVEEPKDFWAFSKAGRKLADLHINYETVPAYKEVKVTGLKSGKYEVEKMRFLKKDRKDTIIYNNYVVIEDIPAKAYEYVVNGKSAIEWIMERYQVTTHKESGITNNPNDWATEVGNPRYILDLLLSIINVSVQTVDIVASLPKMKFE
ncbi:MAG TPA: type ISP restriction/modification enzyme [Flavipsychrobacter sp.]|nr:type ISP restriction/modification enzyme [Flavipsychrobacter sp.]